MQLALGLIETKGLIGAIEAADAMAKAANIKILNKEKSTAALVTIKIEGEVAAVKSAVDAGAAAAQRVGQLLSAHVIPRPHADIDFIISQNEPVTSPGSSGTVTESVKQADSTRTSSRPKKNVAVKSEEPVELKVEKDAVEIPVKEESEIKQAKEETEGESTSTSGAFAPADVEAISPAESTEEDLQQDEDQESLDLDAVTHLDRLREEAKSEITSETTDEDTEESVEDESISIPPMDELEKLNVHALRKLARSIEYFPIKGREISKANRGTLLDYFSKY